MPKHTHTHTHTHTRLSLSPLSVTFCFIPMPSLEKIWLFPSWVHLQPTGNRHSITLSALIQEMSGVPWLLFSSYWLCGTVLNMWLLGDWVSYSTVLTHRHQGVETLYAEDVLQAGNDCTMFSWVFPVGNPSTCKCGLIIYNGQNSLKMKSSVHPE